MSVFNNITSSFTESFARIGRNRVRRELLNLSDRQLEDHGFSRYLLNQGVSAWPWRVEEDRNATVINLSAAQSLRDAVIDSRPQYEEDNGKAAA